MRTFYTRLKATAVFLAFLVLFQGCVVYHKTQTTLEQAQQENIKTKIMTTDYETTKYKYITYEEGTFYGVNKKSGEYVKTLLNEDEVVKVFTKNKRASTWATVLTIGVPVIGITIAGIIAANSISVGWGY